MPEPTDPKPSAGPAKPNPKPRRSWLRRLGRGLLWTLLIVAVFHRPLFHTGARLALIFLAKRNNVTLDVHFSGTIWTNLTVRDVSATPNGKGPTPVEKIAIQSVRLEYSLPMLVKHGVGEFLRSYEIHHAELAFVAKPSADEEEKKKKKSIAEDLNNLLAQPALYADRVRIEDFNITVRSETSNTEVRGIDLLFAPTERGFFRIARVQAPGVPVWENLSASTSYAGRNLFIEGLTLSPELVVDSLNFDASQRSQDKGSTELIAHLFGGTLDLKLSGEKLKKKGENLASAYNTILTVTAGGIDVKAAAAYFGAKNLPPMQLGSLTMHFRGEPEKPRTWDGDIGLRVEGLSFGTTTLDAVGLQATFHQGLAEIGTGDLTAFGATVALSGRAQLPETVNDFPGTDGEVGFTIKVPDLLVPTTKFLPAQPIAGAVEGQGKATARARHANAEIALTATGAGSAQAGAGSIKLQASGEKNLDAKDVWFRGLSAKVALDGAQLYFTGFSVDSVGLRAEMQEDAISIRSLEVARGENRVAANGSYRLPADAAKIGPATGEFSVKVPELASFGFGANGETLSGKIDGTGKVATTPDNILRGEVSVDVAEFAFGEKFGVSGLKLQASGRKDLNAQGSAFNGLTAQAALDGNGLRASNFTADSASVNAEMRDDLLTLQGAEVIAGDNRVTARGTYRLPSEGTTGLGPIDSEFALKIPDLKAFGLGAKEEVLSGRINGSGKVATALDGKLGGEIEIEGGDFAFGQFAAQRLGAKVTVANDEAQIEELTLQINKTDRIALSGKVGVQKPFAYEGALLVLFKDLASLQPLLATFGVEEKFTGALDFSAESAGKIEGQEHAGQLKLAIDRAAYGKIDLKEARLAGIFGAGFAETTELRAVSGATSFQGGLEWRDAKLKLRDIVLQQGPLPAVTGFIIVPFDPANRERPIPFDKRIAANVNAKDLDIDKLMTSLGKPSSMSGTITANVLAGGTLLKPTAHVKIAARGLRAKAAAQLDPAEIDFTAHYSENELTLDTVARQKNIQPLTIKGHVPLDLEAVIQQKKLDPNLPLDLTVKLPNSSLAFLPTVVPALRRIEGTAGIDARVSGTVEKPQFSGAAALKIEFARMKQESVPAIGGFQADIGFTEESVTLRRFRGEVGGGTFEVTGGAKFPKITEPVIDLRVRSDDVLVKRDDSVTVRVDTDVNIGGPLAKGAVKGTVWVTNSRFFRDIDILPIALPGRPKPKPEPKSVPSEKNISFDKPPLRDWTFDVAIKTRPNDPFQIRGNLANGSAAIDLRFAGTGLEPYVEGGIRVENFVASLPFSRLQITRGFVNFTRDAPFEPKLDLMAESELREYRITAYIYGTAKDPQLSLTSEPPLAQQDILALLATGTTTAELTGNSDVLASRAAALLFQQLYRKVFKKNDPLQKVPVLDRLNLEVGAVDSKTGRQEITTQFRLGENVYLVGDVDVAGEFKGSVKYLLRFR